MAETGYAKNVEHFGTLISFVEGYGGTYDPTNPSIVLTALEAKLTAASSAINDVIATLAPWKTKVNDRESAYEGIRKLVTRIVNSFAASGAPQNAIDNAKSFKRKIDGARAKALPKDDPETPEDESKGHSVSQRSYTQVLDNFDELIAFLNDQSTYYNPNEPDLQIPALQARSTAMKNANSVVTAAATPLSNARLARNEELYAKDKASFKTSATPAFINPSVLSTARRMRVSKLAAARSSICARITISG